MRKISITLLILSTISLAGCDNTSFANFLGNSNACVYSGYPWSPCQ